MRFMHVSFNWCCLLNGTYLDRAREWPFHGTNHPWWFREWEERPLKSSKGDKKELEHSKRITEIYYRKNMKNCWHHEEKQSCTAKASVIPPHRYSRRLVLNCINRMSVDNSLSYSILHINLHSRLIVIFYCTVKVIFLDFQLLGISVLYCMHLGSVSVCVWPWPGSPSPGQESHASGATGTFLSSSLPPSMQPDLSCRS
jgi:hypothetical protein